jgi:hypothetical protein
VSWKLRLGVVAVMAAATLTAAAAALAAISPQLSVSSSPTLLTLHYQQGASDDVAAKLNFLVPQGYLANVGQLPGELVASATGHAASGAVTGTIVAANATDPLTVGTTSTTVAAAAAACTGPVTVGGQWLAKLTVGTTQVQVPVVYQTVLPLEPYSDIANAAIILCPPASIGAISDLTLTFKQVFSVAPGWYVWRSVVTPATATGTPNTAAMVEAQSEDRTPQDFVLTGRKVGKGAVVRGSLREGGKGLGGQTVQLLSGKKVVARAKTTGAGGFVFRFKKLTAPLHVYARTVVPGRKLASCQAPLPLTPPCSSATIGGFTARTATVNVK